MSKAFKLRYVNEIAGAFVLVSVVLLVVGIYVAGRAQGWFEPTLELRTVFPAATGALGLQKGAEVRILGTLAGRVGDINPNEEGNLDASYIINGRFLDLVRTNSVAIIKKKFQVAGDAYVEITLGDRRCPRLINGDYIRSVEDVEIIETAKRMLEDVRSVVIPMMEEIQQILAHVNGITASIDEGRGTLGQFIQDPQVANQLKSTMGDLQKTAAQLPALLANVSATATDFRDVAGAVKSQTLVDLQKTIASLPPILDDVGATVKQMKQMSTTLNAESANVEGLIVQTQSTLREGERVLAAMRRHWLLRKYAEQPEEEPILAPMELRDAGEAKP